MLADLFLVAGESSHGAFQITGHHGLQAIAIKAYQLAQEGYRQQILPLALFLKNDLGQDRACDVFARLSIPDGEVFAVLDHAAQGIQGHITGRRSIVEAPVGVFLDDNGVFRFIRHISYARLTLPAISLNFRR